MTLQIMCSVARDACANSRYTDVESMKKHSLASYVSILRSLNLIVKSIPRVEEPTPSDAAEMPARSRARTLVP